MKIATRNNLLAILSAVLTYGCLQWMKSLIINNNPATECYLLLGGVCGILAMLSFWGISDGQSALCIDSGKYIIHSVKTAKKKDRTYLDLIMSYASDLEEKHRYYCLPLDNFYNCNSVVKNVEMTPDLEKILIDPRIEVAKINGKKWFFFGEISTRA